MNTFPHGMVLVWQPNQAHADLPAREFHVADGRSQVVGLQDAAGRCARMLCTLYLVSIVPVSILLTVFISALKLV